MSDVEKWPTLAKNRTRNYQFSVSISVSQFHLFGHLAHIFQPTVLVETVSVHLAENHESSSLSHHAFTFDDLLSKKTFINFIIINYYVQILSNSATILQISEPLLRGALHLMLLESWSF